LKSIILSKYINMQLISLRVLIKKINEFKETIYFLTEYDNEGDT